MKNIIDKIFKEEDFTQESIENNLYLFYRTENKMREYFLIHYIDTTNDMKKLHEELFKIENNFISKKNIDNKKNINLSIRSELINKLPEEYVSELDKNLSLILVIKLDNLQELANYKNEVYALEESPRFFKKYVLPYTESQINLLKEQDHNEKSMELLLNELINDINGYNKLIKDEYYDGLYSFIVRLFSKIPFLKYKFENTSPIEKLQNRISEEMKNRSSLAVAIDKSNNTEQFSIDEFIVNVNITDEEIENEIKQIIISASQKGNINE